ncbi:MAG: alcohol dehydrogenase catalytic domain-containing protein [Gemmobacter sp.]
MTPIRAAVCTAPGAPLRIETLHLAPPGPGQVQVRIRAVAICHSDIGYVEGAWRSPLPAVFGHEAAGVVQAVGPGVRGIAPRDAVLVTLIRHCGTCPACRDGAPVHCETPPSGAPVLHRPDGTAVEQGFACAAFAEAVTVDESQIVPLPDDIAPEPACLLSCGVITGVGAAVNSARIRPGERVVVIGAGGVGLNAIQGARIAGAAHVVAVDLSPGKLADAADFGATVGILADSDKPWRAAQAAMGGRGADAVLVAAGALPAYEAAPRYLARRGRMVMVGMPPSGAKAGYEPVILSQLGQSLRGSYMGDAQPRRDIGWLIALYRQGRLKLDELVTGRFPLERIGEAIADTKAGRARRNVIVFPED